MNDIKYRNYFYVVKDNDEKWMRFEATGRPVKGEYIFVTDKEDVYVAGYSGHRSLRNAEYVGDFRPHIWKNGYRIYFGEYENNDWYSCHFYGIYVDDRVGVLVTAFGLGMEWGRTVLNGKQMRSSDKRFYAPKFVATGDTRQQAIDDSKKHWQEHGALYGRDSDFVKGHKYRIMNILDSEHFFIAKDDDETWMKFVGDTRIIGTSIFVTNSEDVYVVGTTNRDKRNLVWKNGVRFAYGDERRGRTATSFGDNDITGAGFRQIWVWGNDVFVAGVNFKSAEEREEGDRNKPRVEALMLNGKIIAEK
jgi:hypothetical protein